MMSKFPIISIESASKDQATVLEKAERACRFVPNLMGTLANSAAVVDRAYLARKVAHLIDRLLARDDEAYRGNCQIMEGQFKKYFARPFLAVVGGCPDFL